MAEVTRLENVAQITNGDTITGPAYFYLTLVAGSQTAQLIMDLPGGEGYRLKAMSDTSENSPECIYLGQGVVATFTISGPAVKCYAIFEVD